MLVLPPDLQHVILEQLPPSDVRNITYLTRETRQRWEHLCWRHIEVKGSTQQLCDRLRLLLNALGDDGSHQNWQHVRKFTLLDTTRPTIFISQPPEDLERLMQTSEYNLDLLLSCLFNAVPAAQMQQVVMQMGGKSRDTAYPKTAETLFGLISLRTLSLSTFNPQRPSKMHVPSMRKMARTLQDVIVFDCRNFDIEGLLADQPQLSSVTVEGDDTVGVSVPESLASSWTTLRTLCIDVPKSETEFEWTRTLIHALRSNSLPNLRELALDGGMHGILFGSLLEVLSNIPLIAFRFLMSSCYDLERTCQDWGPKLLEEVFKRLPNLEELCIDHGLPFVVRGTQLIPFNWPGPWKAYRTAFEHATNLKTFYSSVCSVHVPVRGAYSRGMMSVKWGPHIGRSVRAQSRDLFAWCPSLEDVVYMSPSRQLPDFHEHRATTPNNDARFTIHISPAGKGGPPRFWVPSAEREVYGGRHVWNNPHTKLDDAQIFQWDEELDGFPELDDIYTYVPTAQDLASEGDSDGEGDMGFSGSDDNMGEDEDEDSFDEGENDMH